MITQFKIFEEENNDKFNIGDYVVIYNSQQFSQYSAMNYYLKKTAGIITNINIGYSEVNYYEIKFFNMPNYLAELLPSSKSSVLPPGLIYMRSIEIRKATQKEKEKLDLDLAIDKYNL